MRYRPMGNSAGVFVSGVSRVPKHAPHHRLECFKRHGAHVLIKSDVVVFLTESDGFFVAWMAFKSVPAVTISSDLMHVIITLKDRVMLDHPQILTRNERL